jgi:hypothetical protein
MAKKPPRSRSGRGSRSRSSGSNGSSTGSASSSGGSNSRKRKREEFPDYEILDPDQIEGGPDVMLDVPVVKVDEIDVEVEDLRAAVSVRAELRALVKLNVGVAARLGTVELNIQGVEAQALLKARLDNVSQILGRVMTTLDRNPQLLESVGKAVEDVGEGGGGTLAGAGEATEDVGEGAEKALGQVGQGAGQAAQGVGQGAGQAAQGVGQGGSEALQGVGGGAKRLAGGGGGG